MIDPTKAAAELLRRRLGLQQGPVGTPPAGPPKPPPPPPEVTDPAAQDPPPPTPTAPAVTPPTNAAPATQDPPSQPVQDPAEAARRAMQRLLPNAKPPAVAPLPTAQGTPEPVAPGPAGPTAEAAPPPTAPASPPGITWNGTLASRYRLRHGDGATDQDLVSRLGFDVGRAASDPVTFHLGARLYADLDGRRADDPFAGLDQSRDEDVDARLDLAHVDLHRLGDVELVRLGRQDLSETPTPVTFDGSRVDSRTFTAARWYLSGYGGIPVHHYEASARGDSVYGLATGLVPWRGGRLRGDWMALRDDFLAEDRADDLLGVRWWQDLEVVRLRGLHTWRDGKPRDLQLGGDGEWLGCELRADYRELLTAQRAAATELDPFHTIGLDYQPYRQLDVAATRDFGPHWTGGVGAELRRLQDRSDEGQFNREFTRTHADLTVRDVAVNGLSLNVAASLWESDGEHFETLAGDLEYRPHRDLRLQFGTSYDLYRYDSFAEREQVHVRSWFVRGDYRFTAAVRGDASYAIEHTEDDEFHEFRLGVTWTF